MRAGCARLGIAACLLLWDAASAAEPAASERERLARAAAAHPDDPDLAWAAARAFVRAGDPEGAERLAAFDARWPELRPEAALELGKALAALGRGAEALLAFERALARDPDDAAAYLHRALALRALGRAGEAEPDLERAAALAPALVPDVLLLRGLGHLERGRLSEARPLLEQAIALDPAGEVARRARVLLPSGGVTPPGRRLALMAQTGFEFDSNVTLDSGLPLAGTGANRQDGRGVFAAGATFAALRSERASLSVGYRYDGSLHADLSDYDLGSHLGFASLAWRAGERATLRLDGLYSHAFLGGESYGSSALLRPQLHLALGERLGALQLYGELARQGFTEDPALASLVRDGWTWGGGFEHRFRVPGWSAAVLGWGARHARFDSEADRDVLGFAGAYDHRRWEGSVSLLAPLPAGIQARAIVALGHERYDHDNVIDFLTDDGIGTGSPSARRDWVTDASLSLVRPLSRHLDVEVGWRFTDRASNVDLYAYQRHVAGVYFRVHVD